MMSMGTRTRRTPPPAVTVIEVEGKVDVPAGFVLSASRPAEGSAAAVVLAHLQQHIGRLQAHDPLARADAPDAVHQMRVATRRLRSALARSGRWSIGG